MRMSLGNRQFTAALGWGIMFAALSAPGNGVKADEQAKPVRSERSSVAEVGASIHAAQACASQGHVNGVPATNGHPILSRIPYLSRLFANPVEPAADGMTYCLVLGEGGDDSVERIGVDFDFCFEGEQSSCVSRFVSCPNAACHGASPSAAPARTCPELAASCPADLLLVEQLLQKELGEVDCGSDGIETYANGAKDANDASFREKLAAVAAQATILTHLSEMQTELVEARMEMAEKLVETRLECIEQLTQLTIENERLKAKLEFQKEREEFQAKIAELTAQNQTAKMQAAYAAQLQEASHTISQHTQAYAQLLQSHQLSLHRIAELEGKASPRQPTERREEVAERIDRTTPTRSQY